MEKETWELYKILFVAHNKKIQKYYKVKLFKLGK